MKFNNKIAVVVAASTIASVLGGAVPSAFGSGSGSGAGDNTHTGIVKIDDKPTTTGVERRGADRHQGVLGWNPNTQEWCSCTGLFAGVSLPESDLDECCRGYCESCMLFSYFDNCASVAMTPDGHWAVSVYPFIGINCTDTEVVRLAAEYVALQRCSLNFAPICL